MTSRAPDTAAEDDDDQIESFSLARQIELQREELRLLEELHPYRSQARKTQVKGQPESNLETGTYSARFRNTHESAGPSVTVEDFIMQDLRKAAASNHAAYLLSSPTVSREYNPNQQNASSPESSVPPEDEGENVDFYRSVDTSDYRMKMRAGDPMSRNRGSADYSDVTSSPLGKWSGQSAHGSPNTPGNLSDQDSFECSHDTCTEPGRPMGESTSRVLNLSVDQRRSILGDGFLPKWEFENQQKGLTNEEQDIPSGLPESLARIQQANAVAAQVAAVAKKALEAASEVSKRHEHVLSKKTIPDPSLPLETTVHMMGIGAVAAHLELSLAEFKKTYEEKPEKVEEAPVVESTVEELRRHAECALEPQLGAGLCKAEDVDDILRRLESKISENENRRFIEDGFHFHVLPDCDDFELPLPSLMTGHEPRDPDLLHRIKGLRSTLASRIREIDECGDQNDTDVDTNFATTMTHFWEDARLAQGVSTTLKKTCNVAFHVYLPMYYYFVCFSSLFLPSHVFSKTKSSTV